MNKIKIYKCKSAFSLAEVLAALAIGAMVLIAVLGIYGRAETSAAAVSKKLDNARLPAEILQRIAEDLDKIIASGSDTKITIDSTKLEKGYPTSQLRIQKTIYDANSMPKIFEEIVWQASFDYDRDSNGLVLYRSHSGITMEDKLLDEEKEDWQRELFIPICEGITYFKIEAVKDANLFDTWSGAVLPTGIVAAISFAEPFKNENGEVDVFEDEKFIRTMAIDRTRKIKFNVETRESAEQADVNQPEDPNEQADPNNPAEPNKTPTGKVPSQSNIPHE